MAPSSQLAAMAPGLVLSPPARRALRVSLEVLRQAVKVLGVDLFGRQLVAVLALILLRRLLWLLRRVYRRAARNLCSGLSKQAQRAEELRRRRRTCLDYKTFKELGEQLDIAEGKDKWKQDDNSPYFDARRIRERTGKYKELMAQGDVEGCMFCLRQELLRKHFGVCNPALFDTCATGTKWVIEDYVETVCKAMTWVAFSHHHLDIGTAQPTNFQQVAVGEKLAFFNETKHSFGRSALLLSGGAQLGMYHFGVAKALHLNGFLPRIISGTSAGSIVCGCVCVRTDLELQQIWRKDFCWEDNFDLEFFGDVSLRRFLQRKGEALYSADFLGEKIRKNIGDYTFLEAYDRTGRICNITVSGLPGNTQYPMLLNYLTSPHVLIWSAAQASAAVPGVFEPRELLARDRHGQVVPYLPSGLKWRDGSMQNDLPMSRLAELFNVNYFIVSQVNPHAQLMTGGGFGTARGPIYRASQFLRRELKQYLLSMAELCKGGTRGRVSPWLRPVGFSAVGLIAQEYEGDVTIYNGRGLLELPFLLKNGSEEMLRRYTATSEWETWWHLPQIENACAIEFVMDEITRELRAELLGDQKAPSATPFTSQPLLDRMDTASLGIKRVPSFCQQSQLCELQKGAASTPGFVSSLRVASAPGGLRRRPGMASANSLCSLIAAADNVA